MIIAFFSFLFFILIRIRTPLSNERKNHRKAYFEVSRLFRNKLGHLNKHEVLRTGKETKNLSKLFKRSNDLLTTSNNIQSHDLCLFSDSPHYIVRV